MPQQRGILDRPQKHLTLMTLDLISAKAAPAALEELWSDMQERLHDFYAPTNLTITLGFGLPAFEKTGKLPLKPKALRLMPGWEGDAFKPAETQADLLIQVGSDDRGVSYLAETAVRGYLASAFQLRDYETGFGIPDSRGLTGFIDGTGNPHGDDRIPVALIGEEDQRWQGGAYMVFRKIREDIAKWRSLGVEEQQRSIGRGKADGAPLPGGAPANSHKEKSSVKTKDGEIEILRRSFPYASGQEEGLLFLCFVRDLAQFEASKSHMVSRTTDKKDVGRDALMSIMTPISGGYYFVPPQPEGNGYLGDFLFG